jgi:sodium-dependent dicarboxylate transporter 2/3/5
MGGIGYLVGPKDLALGNYSSEIVLPLEDRSCLVNFPFIVGDAPGQPLVVTSTHGNCEISIEGKDAYSYKLGQSITYRVRVIDAQGKPVHLPLENVSSRITGPSYWQTLPPISRSEEWLVFSMRIPFNAKITTAILFAIATLWLTELVPLSAGALAIPVVAVIAAVTDATTVFQPFFHPIVILFFAGFLLAEGMRRTGVDRRIALNILRRSSLKPGYLMLTMMSITAILSMWMSNTASVAILIPIAISILEKIPSELSKTGFRRALILGVAYAATIGGIGSAIGTPANILALTFLNELADLNLAFIDWFYYGLPMVIVMVPLI